MFLGFIQAFDVGMLMMHELGLELSIFQIHLIEWSRLMGRWTCTSVDYQNITTSLVAIV